MYKSLDTTAALHSSQLLMLLPRLPPEAAAPGAGCPSYSGICASIPPGSGDPRQTSAYLLIKNFNYFLCYSKRNYVNKKHFFKQIVFKTRQSNTLLLKQLLKFIRLLIKNKSKHKTKIKIHSAGTQTNCCVKFLIQTSMESNAFDNNKAKIYPSFKLVWVSSITYHFLKF